MQCNSVWHKWSLALVQAEQWSYACNNWLASAAYSCFTIIGSFISCLATGWQIKSNHRLPPRGSGGSPMWEAGNDPPWPSSLLMVWGCPIIFIFSLLLIAYSYISFLWWHLCIHEYTTHVHTCTYKYEMSVCSSPTNKNNLKSEPNSNPLFVMS